MAWVQQPISSSVRPPRHDAQSRKLIRSALLQVANSIISAVSPAARTTAPAPGVEGESQQSSQQPTYAEMNQNKLKPASNSHEANGSPAPTPADPPATPSTTVDPPAAAPLSPPVESSPPVVAAPATLPPAAKSTPAPVKPTVPAPKRAEKKKSSPFGFLLACFPCLSNDAHAPEPASVPLPAGQKTTNEKPLSEKPALAPVAPKVEPVPATSPLPVAAVAAVVAVPVAALATTSAVLATDPILTPEDPQGVTSAAVTPPGKESTLGVTPTKPRRRRSGKAAESIITSVPEPGQEVDDESYDEDDDIDEDEEDEEQNLIARGGVGIPIGEVSCVDSIRARNDF